VSDLAVLHVGNVKLTRVPYFDIALDAGAVGLSAEEVMAVPWATPVWADDSGKVLVGQAVWVIESAGRVIVVDPCGAADQFLRTGPEALTHQNGVLGAMDDAGYPAARVDNVVLSHLDGIGMAAIVAPDGGWAAAFPNARVVLTQAELDWLSTQSGVMGQAALQALLDQGVVDGVPPTWTLTSDVVLEQTGGHTPGHAVIRIRSEGNQCVMVGHLALNPVHVATGRLGRLHFDATGAEVVLDRLLAESAAEDTLLIGPLWPWPGAACVTGPPWTAVPAPA
jgi:glyoxylase-like metal-dependent hydrolase (beta-lactamase superfamily II)